MIRKFLSWNVRASMATTPHQLWEARCFAIYPWVARALLGGDRADVVADVGGGRTWHFAEHYWANPAFRLIGIDVDGNELAMNPMLDRAIETDACKSLGVDDGSIDVILSRATIEHLPDTSAFLRNAYRALRPGGMMAVVFANKWAPAMLINRLLPEKLAQRLLLTLVPETKNYGGFKAYYDKCSYTEFRHELRSVGFEIEYDYVSYYCSSYFQFFLPLHILSIMLDLLRQIISIKNIGSMNLFVVRKPEDS